MTRPKISYQKNLLQSELYDVFWNHLCNLSPRLSHLGPSVGKAINEPLDCADYREFWVSWAKGVIEVGSGLIVEDNTFLHYTHLSPYEVNYIGISTYRGTKGYWEINCKGRNVFVFNYIYSSPYEVNYIGITIYWGVRGHWEISCERRNMF